MPFKASANAAHLAIYPASGYTCRRELGQNHTTGSSFSVPELVRTEKRR